MEELYNNIKDFFVVSRSTSNEPTFWLVTTAKTPHVKGRNIGYNYSIKDLDKSFSMLVDVMETHKNNLDQYIKVFLKTSKSDSSPLELMIKNTMYQDQQQISGFIGSSHQQSSFIGSNNPHIGEIMRLQDEKHKEELKRLEERFENERQIDYLQSQIEEIKEAKKTFYDRLGGILDHPAMVQVLTTVASNLGVQMLNAGKNQNNNVQQTTTAEPTKPETQETEIQEAEQNTDVLENDLSIQLGEDLQEIEKILGSGESLQVIHELAILAKSQPQLLRQLRPSLKNMSSNE
jgi:hypothetical protein